MALLQIDAVSKSFDDQAVLREVSFQVDEGEIVCLLGPSGCGKTTMLRIIAGLDTADSGEVTLNGRVIAEVPVHRRGFGLMFQDLALFPHKDVAGNAAFGLQMQGLPPDQVQARVAEMLDLVGLAGYEKRRVYELSGGEQQRVALARSLAPGPGLLMLDEPLGSLDRALREELMNELRAILKRVGVTAVYVTHDQQEAFAVADRVMIMDRGRIVQQGTPRQVYRQPASPWVARFLGLNNLLPGQVVVVEAGRVVVETPIGRLAVWGTAGAAAVGQDMTVLIRPEAARLAGECTVEDAALIAGVVSKSSFRGGYCHLILRCEQAPAGRDWQSQSDLTFDLALGAGDLPGPGEVIRLAVQPEAISLLPAMGDLDG